MSHDPAWMTDEHRAWRDAVRAFFAAELVPHQERWRAQGVVDRELWAKAGELGILGATIPEEYGGAGLPKSFDAVSIQEQGRTGDSGWGMPLQSIVSHYIQGHGTEAQKRRWLPLLASGERVAAVAMTEPGTGSDLQALATTAVRDGDHYVINGSKTFISNGQTADLVVVAAKTDPMVPGYQGMSLFVVETDGLEGFSRGRNLPKLGQKSADTSELFFTDVRVPADTILGETEGMGFLQLMVELPWERLAIGVACLGAAECALDETLRYTKERRAFKRRVFDFQNTRFKLADVKTKIEVTRSFVNDCIGRADAGTLDAATAWMAKVWGSEILGDVVDD